MLLCKNLSDEQPVDRRRAKLFVMTRRRLAFWLGMCLFWIAHRARANVMDDLAAGILRRVDPRPQAEPGPSQARWIVAEDDTWLWYEREVLIRQRWTAAGMTTRVNKQTGQLERPSRDCLSINMVPGALRLAHEPIEGQRLERVREKLQQAHADPDRRARDGRPPSKWLRSLNAAEIRIWLKTVDVPEFGVSDMTFLTHLTRDHSFDSSLIIGLTIAEQAKLHSAAHFGY